MNLRRLLELYSLAGCSRLYAKTLAANDNSKNQVYFAGAVEVLNMLPSKQVLAENTSRGPSFKAILAFGWLLESGEISPVPAAQLILYAQYPEVRFSGFLRGCEHAPADLMSARLPGRVLFLGVTADERVIGYVAGPDSEVVREFRGRDVRATGTVLVELALPRVESGAAARQKLLRRLGEIADRGWIDSKQLHSDGSISSCLAPQCGGYTLEAELGIAKNSKADPDFLGWEVKQHAVSSLKGTSLGGPITLMTPEPTGGVYQDEGVETFVRRFGYPDRLGRVDRMNFGGVHKVGLAAASTGLTMALQGYEIASGKISDASGCLALVSPKGVVAASWSFGSLLQHWSRKHALAVYVPSTRRIVPRRQYAYGHRIRLAQGTNSLLLLQALASGTVYYDPGIKLESVSGEREMKRRSQFRVASRNIGVLYDKIETVII